MFQFMGLLLLLLTLECVICLVLLLHHSTISHSLISVLQDRLAQDYGREGDWHQSFTQAMDYTQLKLHCCGLLGPSDYSLTATNTWRMEGITFFSGHRLEVPRTCCTLLNSKVNEDKQHMDDMDDKP